MSSTNNLFKSYFKKDSFPINDKCTSKTKILQKNKLLSDAVNGEILSPENNFEVVVKSFKKKIKVMKLL